MRVLILCAGFLFMAMLLTPPDLVASAGQAAILSCQYAGRELGNWDCLNFKLSKTTLEVLYSYFSIGHIKL